MRREPSPSSRLIPSAEASRYRQAENTMLSSETIFSSELDHINR
jgi:hypothetical protein